MCKSVILSIKFKPDGGGVGMGKGEGKGESEYELFSIPKRLF